MFSIHNKPIQQQIGLRSLVNVVKRIKMRKKHKLLQELLKQNALLCIMRRNFVKARNNKNCFWQSLQQAEQWLRYICVCVCVSVKTVVERKQQTNNIYCSEQSNQYIKERIKQKGREEGNQIKRKEMSLACFEDENC